MCICICKYVWGVGGGGGTWRLMICEATRAPARPMADTPCPRRYAHRTPAAYASPAPQVSIGALVVQCGGTTCTCRSRQDQHNFVQ